MNEVPVNVVIVLDTEAVKYATSKPGSAIPLGVGDLAIPKINNYDMVLALLVNDAVHDGLPISAVPETLDEENKIYHCFNSVSKVSGTTYLIGKVDTLELSKCFNDEDEIKVIVHIREINNKDKYVYKAGDRLFNYNRCVYETPSVERDGFRIELIIHNSYTLGDSFKDPMGYTPINTLRFLVNEVVENLILRLKDIFDMLGLVDEKKELGDFAGKEALNEIYTNYVAPVFGAGRGGGGSGGKDYDRRYSKEEEERLIK